MSEISGGPDPIMLSAPMLPLIPNARRWAHLLAALGALALLPSATHALSILPGATALAAGEADPTGGAVIASSFDSFSTASFAGTVTTSVISGDASNPHGGLTFTYLLTSDPMSTHSIGRATFNGFTSFATDVSYQVPPSGVAPTSMDRSGDGDTVGFTFLGVPLGGGALPPGTGSALLVIQTDATEWHANIASIINGSVINADILAPNPSTAVPVPEPGAALVFLSGLLVMGRTLRRGQR
jgi:hypothetical protein